MEVCGFPVPVSNNIADCIAIGDDGGGLVFLMKQEVDAKEVFCVDVSDYDIESAFCRLDNHGNI